MVDNGRGPQPCNMLLTLQTAGLTTWHQSARSEWGLWWLCGWFLPVFSWWARMAVSDGLEEVCESDPQTSLSDNFYMILKHLSLLSRSKRSRQFAYKLTLFVQWIIIDQWEQLFLIVHLRSFLRPAAFDLEINNWLTLYLRLIYRLEI